MTTEDTTQIVPIRPLMQFGPAPRRRAANTNLAKKPARLRANDTVLIGDLLIWIKGAAEESRDTGMSFEDCLLMWMVDDLSA